MVMNIISVCKFIFLLLLLLISISLNKGIKEIELMNKGVEKVNTSLEALLEKEWEIELE